MGRLIKELSVYEMDTIRNSENRIIYGAGNVCIELMETLRTEGIDDYHIAVTRTEGEQFLCGKRVEEISSLISYKDNSLVIIAVNNWKTRSEIKDTLSELGFNNYFALGDGVQEQCMREAVSKIDDRLRNKKQYSEKINAVFVCHRPQVWNTMKTIYEALKTDSHFNTTIVAIPDKKCLPEIGWSDKYGYESEGAEAFWSEYGCINGYDYGSGEWFDLRKLSPDYVFFQQPYNVMKPEQYNSSVVSQYAKICYVAYGYEMMRGAVIEGSHPEDFFRNVSFYFAQDRYNQDFTEEYLNRKKNNFTKSVLTGYPKFDEVQIITKPVLGKGLKAVWCPRWTETEGNCNFLDYGELLPDLFEKRDDMQLVFRPHPQMRVDINAEDNRKSRELERIVCGIKNRNNTRIDEKDDYKEAFSWSDCLIADMTSLMGDYFLTGKPIIYCHKVDCFSEAGRHLSEGFYRVENWTELKETIEMLASGEDPLFEKRQQIIKEHYYLPKGGAGKKIMEFIKADALK